MTSQRVDIHALTVRRPASSGQAISRPRRWFSRVALPALILAGFAALLVWSAWDALLPATPVSVTPVLVRAGTIQAAGTSLFSATGWLEPGPTPIEVPALAEGVVERLLVLPGQHVNLGDPVALLIDADARLALQAAEDDLAERKLKVRTAEADLAEAEAQLRGTEAAVKADADLFQNKLIGPTRYEQTQAQRGVAAARVEQARARLAEAKVRVRQGETLVATARLRLERMTVRAPCHGIVTSLNAQPGSMVGRSSNKTGSPDSVVSLYEPEALQVRIEVPIDKFQLVQPGQPVVLELDVLPNQRIPCTVLYDTHETGLNGNTVRVKASFDRPPAAGFAWPWPLPGAGHLATEGAVNVVHAVQQRLTGPWQKLRPGMVARVSVLAPPTSAEIAPTESLRLFVPQRLLLTESGQGAVWLVDQSAGRALLRQVTPGSARDGELIEITQGLLPSDKLITSSRTSLSPGLRVKITNEEP